MGNMQWRKPGAEFGGWRKNFSPTKITFFSEKISNFHWFFWSSYMTLSSQEKNLFYSFYTFAHIRQHYFSKYWGDECMGRPPPQTFLGGPSPSPPRFPPLGICNMYHWLKGMDSPVCRLFMVFVRRPLITGSESKRGNPYIKYIWGTIGGAWMLLLKLLNQTESLP